MALNTDYVLRTGAVDHEGKNLQLNKKEGNKIVYVFIFRILVSTYHWFRLI